jgi:hypothetical protein
MTAPCTHNGVLPGLEHVIDFYNPGGGICHGVDKPNQTLSPDHLGISDFENSALKAIMESLNDTKGMASGPERIPLFEDNKGRGLKGRLVGNIDEGMCGAYTRMKMSRDTYASFKNSICQRQNRTDQTSRYKFRNRLRLQSQMFQK